jgi:hypothetical protein
MLQFDSGLEVFTGNQSTPANQLLGREYRAGFEVPAVG